MNDTTNQNEDLPRHLSASDSVAWRIENDPLLRSTITVVLLLDQAPNHRAMRNTIEAASIAFPRLRQRVVSMPFRIATPVWSTDPNFDLDYHVRTVRASGDRGQREVHDLAAAIAMDAFDRARPLWQWVTVDGLEDGRSAVIVKLHHSVTDGVGGIQLMTRLFDFERHDGAVPRTREGDIPVGERTDPARLLLEGLRHQAGVGRTRLENVAGGVVGAARHPRSAAESTLRGLASTARLVAPASGPLSTLMTERSPRYRFEAFDLPLADLKQAARRIDGKLNDAFMTGVVLGLRAYHEAHDAPLGAVRVNMPVNLRTDTSGSGGNHWAPARFVVPLSTGDADDQMREVHDLVAAQRAEPALQYAGAIAAVLDQLPTPLLSRLFGRMLTCLDVAATNVPGAPIPVYLAGAEVTDMQAFAPPSGAAVNVALLSYRDHASVALNIDPAAVPDFDLMLASIRRGFDMVINPEPVAGHPVRPARRRSRRVNVAPTPI